MTLIGHSAGGGFALRVAGSPIKDLFARTVLLAPYLGYDAPTNRPNSGGWANADMPRIFGWRRCAGSVSIAARHCRRWPSPCRQFGQLLAPTYSYRLMRNFATRGYRSDLAAVTKPLTMFSGAADELMLPDKYEEAAHAVEPSVDVKLIDGINHIGIVCNPAAVSAIAEDVATRGAAGS